MNNPFSAFSRRERFWAYTIITMIIAALAGFAGYAGMLLYQKIQESNSAPDQAVVAPAPLNTENNLVNPPDVWNARNGGSTNTAASAPAADNSQTNSN